jgi:hypothetical protein
MQWTACCKLRGRPSNNRISAVKRNYILSLIRSDHPDFGPTLAAEKLAERHGIRVSSESLRQWMKAAGLLRSGTASTSQGCAATENANEAINSIAFL